MLEGIKDNELTVGVLNKTIAVGEHKQCKCATKAVNEKNISLSKLLDELLGLLLWQGEEKIGTGR